MIYITCSRPHLIEPHFYLENSLKSCLHSPSAFPLLPSSLQSSSVRVSSPPRHLGPHIQLSESSSYLPYQEHVIPQTLESSLTCLCHTPHPLADHVSPTCKILPESDPPQPLYHHNLSPSTIIADQHLCINLLTVLLLLPLSSTFLTWQPE